MSDSERPVTGQGNGFGDLTGRATRQLTARTPGQRPMTRYCLRAIVHASMPSPISWR